MQSMVINDRQITHLAQLLAFLNGTMAVDFAVAAEERHGFIGRTLRRFSYGRLKRAQKVVVLSFLKRVSGYSRPQHRAGIEAFQQTLRQPLDHDRQMNRSRTDCQNGVHGK